MTQPERKLILCLANSRKHYGRCVAGIELVDRRPVGWIRPVSSRVGGEVSEYERNYEDGSDPRVLDIISVPLLEPAPDGYQTENWILSPEDYWMRTGQIGWEHLARLESAPALLWPSEDPSTFHGASDRVSADVAHGFIDSLRLIRVQALHLRVFAPGRDFGNPKRRVQATFVYVEVQYGLWVTDPVIEREYLARDDGTYQLGESYLTISLGERSDDGYCYKLVAAVIERARVQGGG
jgi:hypothetical protein